MKVGQMHDRSNLLQMVQSNNGSNEAMAVNRIKFINIVELDSVWPLSQTALTKKLNENVQ